MRPIKSACWIGLLVLALGLAGGRPTGAAPAAGQATPRLALLGSTTFANQHPANGVAVQGRYAYVAYGDAAYEGYGLRIVDLQNPASPAIVGGVNLRPPGQTGQVNAVAVAGAYAYLAAGYEGLKIIDVANPAAPRVVATYLPPPYQFVWDVAVSGTRAYLGLGDSILIVDVAAANRPRLLGQLVAQVKTIHVSGTTPQPSRGDFHERHLPLDDEL